MGLMRNMMRQIGDENKAKGNLKFSVTWAQVEMLESETSSELRNAEINGVFKGIAVTCVAYVGFKGCTIMYGKIKARRKLTDDSSIEESNK